MVLICFGKLYHLILNVMCGPQWFENERQRLINLRDRASEKGRKKEYPFLTGCMITYMIVHVINMNMKELRI